MAWVKRGHPEHGFGYGKARRLSGPYPAPPDFYAAHVSRMLRGGRAGTYGPTDTLPDKTNNRQFVTIIRDQKQRGACVNFATGGAVYYLQIKDGVPPSDAVFPSPQAGDYLCRRTDGLEDMTQDTGTFLATEEQVYQANGFNDDRFCPYGDSATDVARAPGELYMRLAYDQSAAAGPGQKAQTAFIDFSSAPSDDAFMDLVDLSIANGAPQLWCGDVSNPFAMNALDPSKAVDVCPPSQVDGGHCMYFVDYALVTGAEAVAFGVADGEKVYFVVNSWGPDFMVGGAFWATRKMVLSRNEHRALSRAVIEGKVAA